MQLKPRSKTKDPPKMTPYPDSTMEERCNPSDSEWLMREGQGHEATGGILEQRFDASLTAALAQKEKQIQQNYRPIIGVHKWFARRPGALFRALLLSEFAREGPLRDRYFESHDLGGRTILDPFMGGGTSMFEANRIGMNVIGCDVNPMAYWIVRQELGPLDRNRFRASAEEVIADVEASIGSLYRTTCTLCGARDATVKYFLWVKRQRCESCHADFDLSPGPVVAVNRRHPNYVFHCPSCHQIIERKDIPANSIQCPCCRKRFGLQGTAKRNVYKCPSCRHEGRYPREMAKDGPPRHRLFAIEYFCARCKEGHKGRFFKKPDPADLARVTRASKRLEVSARTIPDDPIPEGAETTRLHRWGYGHFRELFNERQLLGLSLLADRIMTIEDRAVLEAVATVFSDTLRYQNMLSRYDTMALKCQDIFSVHGFPVGLIQCENNILGIPYVGSGGFRHFIEKYDRAKAYCEEPFETVFSNGGRKRLLPVPGERIAASFVGRMPSPGHEREAWLAAGSVEELAIPEASLDGVFTDPPYYGNVQYAELMDFCYIWLRRIFSGNVKEFEPTSTRTDREIMGNKTLGRGLEFFTEGLSRVFCASSRALKRGSPFVFTYHHNDIEAYAPVCVALLDAGLRCTAVLPAPAEMSASLHINGTGSSTVDSVIISRCGSSGEPDPVATLGSLERALQQDASALAAANLKVTRGDIRCLALGLVLARANRRLFQSWDAEAPIEERLFRVRSFMAELRDELGLDGVIDRVCKNTPSPHPSKSRVTTLLR